MVVGLVGRFCRRSCIKGAIFGANNCVHQKGHLIAVYDLEMFTQLEGLLTRRRQQGDPLGAILEGARE